MSDTLTQAELEKLAHHVLRDDDEAQCEPRTQREYDLSQGVLALLAENRALRADLKTLRLNMAKHLAPEYPTSPLATARLCDEVLDPSGALLGYVREEAIRRQQETRT